MKVAPLLFAPWLLACGSDGGGAADAAPGPDTADTWGDPVAVEMRLTDTLDELAAFGWKRTGTPEGAAAGEYVAQRFRDLGLEGVAFEPFSFLSFELASSSLAVTADGTALPMAHDVFAYSGSGTVDAEVVFTGRGQESDYVGVDVTGKVVLVQRDPYFHRSSQYRLIVAHGGAAMLYISASPDNLIQIGTVTDPEGGLGPIPSVTVGQDDGQMILDAITAGQLVRAAIDVQAAAVPATGRNVVARLPGAGASGAYLLVGAHYDTWQIGSADNSTGVAAMLEVAEALANRGPRAYGVVFVGYDGEEQGLFGGYDYLRDHVVVAGEPMLAFINFEMPSADAGGVRALARTNGGPIHDAILATQTDYLFHLYVGMEVVPSIFGGIIPTDIQGMYWWGLQGLSTACDTPYYHTVEDTPEKIDTTYLADSAIHFERALAMLDEVGVAPYQVHDPEVWRIDVVDPDPAALVIQVGDAAGTPQAGAVVTVWVDVDDFTRVHLETVTAGATGQAMVSIPPAALAAGAGSRWLHITAGREYPFAEAILPLP